MSVQNSLVESCDKILKSVRNSPLNYIVQETQFSIYITVRKTKVKFNVSNKLEAKCDDSTTMSNYAALEEAHKQLKNDYEEVVADSELKYAKIKELEEVIDNIHVKLTEKTLGDSKLEALNAKLENLSSENKAFKTENIEKKSELKKVKKRFEEKENALLSAVACNEALKDEVKSADAEKRKLSDYLKKLKLKQVKSSLS